jgi:hypothetical protein
MAGGPRQRQRGAGPRPPRHVPPSPRRAARPPHPTPPLTPLPTRLLKPRPHHHQNHPRPTWESSSRSTWGIRQTPRASCCRCGAAGGGAGGSAGRPLPRARPRAAGRGCRMTRAAEASAPTAVRLWRPLPEPRRLGGPGPTHPGARLAPPPLCRCGRPLCTSRPCSAPFWPTPTWAGEGGPGPGAGCNGRRARGAAAAAPRSGPGLGRRAQPGLVPSTHIAPPRPCPYPYPAPPQFLGHPGVLGDL